MKTPFAITATLLNPLPPAKATAPPGFRTLRQDLTTGLPALVRLEQSLQMIVSVSSGEVRYWTGMASSATVRDLAAEAMIAGGDTAEAPALPVRLLIVDGNRFVGSVTPLCRRRQIVDTRQAGTVASAFELIVLGLVINAGSLRGQGDFGSFVELAWRPLTRAGARFQAPTAGPRARRILYGMQAGHQTAPDRAGDTTPEPEDGSPLGGLQWRLLHDGA